MDVRPTLRRRLPAFVALLLAGLLVARCSGSADDASDSSGGQPAAAPAEARQGAADQEQSATGSAPTQLGTRNRPLVYTGSMSVTAGNVPDAASKAISAANAAGGYVAADRREVTGSDDDVSATLTLKVPSPKFTVVVDQLAKLGKETARQLGTEDLKAEGIDLDSRIAAQRASVNRVRALLGRANTITELASIERELTTREAELAASEAAKRTAADRTSYSTITLSLNEPAAEPKPEPKKERGLFAGLKHGWSAFVTTVVVLLTIVGWLAPFLLGLAIVGVPIWWAFRRYRPRGAAPVSPAPLEKAPAPAEKPSAPAEKTPTS